MDYELSPDRVQELVTNAFCFEVISNKEGCTNRCVDLPGKPLDHFIASAIVSGKYFRFLAEDIINEKNPGVFDYFLNAVIDSRNASSGNLVNFGLVQIMFPVIYSRILCNDSEKVIDKITKLVKRINKKDVEGLTKGTLEAWKNSSKEYRKNFQPPKVLSIFDFYFDNLNNTNIKRDIGAIDWTQEFVEGFPILKYFYDYFKNSEGNLTDRIAESFNEIREKRPIKVGVISDMCAAAIFLHLSYGRT